MAPWVRSPGTSFQVVTATTPGSAAARAVSIRTILARGWSEKRIAPWSMFGTAMSLTNGLSPRASSSPSYRPVREPTRPLRSTSGIGSPRFAAADSSTASTILM